MRRRLTGIAHLEPPVRHAGQEAASERRAAVGRDGRTAACADPPRREIEELAVLVLAKLGDRAQITLPRRGVEDGRRVDDVACAQPKRTSWGM